MREVQFVEQNYGGEWAFCGNCVFNGEISCQSARPDNLCQSGSSGYYKGEQVSSTFDTQVGGSHYKVYEIQPAEYCQKNRLNHCESSIVKYATRHQDKNGAEDVKKIIHYAQMILEIEYGE